MAGVLGCGPRPWRAVLDHAPLLRRPGLLHPVLVRRAARGEDAAQIPLAELLVAFGGAALAAVSDYDEAQRTAVQLRDAADARSLVDQAKGILMHALGCSAEEALDRMRQVSQRNNMRTTEVAATIIEPGRSGRRGLPVRNPPVGSGPRVRSGATVGGGAPVGAGRRGTRGQALTWFFTCADWAHPVPDVPDRQPPGDGVAELRARHEALQQTATMPGADLRPLLDVALAELDGVPSTRWARRRPSQPQAARTSGRQVPCTLQRRSPHGACSAGAFTPPVGAGPGLLRAPRQPGRERAARSGSRAIRPGSRSARSLSRRLGPVRPFAACRSSPDRRAVLAAGSASC